MPSPPQRTQTIWSTAVIVTGAVAIAGIGILQLHHGHPALTWIVALAAVAAASGIGMRGVRTNQRRRSLNLAEATICAHTKTRVEIGHVRWTKLAPNRMQMRYPPGAAVDLAGRNLLVGQICAAASQTFGMKLAVADHDNARGQITLIPATTEASTRTGADRSKDRVVDVVAQVFGATATTTKVKFGGDDVDRFTVEHRNGPKVADPDIQRKLTRLMSALLPGKWSAKYHLQTDRIEFYQVPPLPTYVPRQAVPITATTADLIPQAVDEQGNICYWDISGVMAHMLKAGKTRTGKSVSLIGDAIEASRRGFQVFVLDPKRTEFLGLRDWPNVVCVATTPAEQIALVRHMWLLMEERYRQVEEDGAREDQFDRVVFIVDEYRQFYSAVRSWWSQHKVTGMPSECPVFDWIGSLLRMAGACRIHIILATQRPDADFLKGEIRDNFSARCATGRLSPDGAQMMFDSQQIGVTIPLSIRGRGTMIDTDDNPREVQFLYTPDPRKATSAEDLDLLAQLRPDKVTWTRKIIQLGDERIAQDQANSSKTKTCAAWMQILLSQLVDYQPPTNPNTEPELEPVEPDTDDPYAAYRPPAVIHTGHVEIGDLVLLEDDEWATVTDLDADEGQILLLWRTDTDNDGAIASSPDEMITCRKPR